MCYLEGERKTVCEVPALGTQSPFQGGASLAGVGYLGLVCDYLDLAYCLPEYLRGILEEISNTNMGDGGPHVTPTGVFGVGDLI